MSNDQLWLASGLHQFQLVRCEVTAHRGRFGVDVTITSPQSGVPAFVDFINLTDSDEHVTPAEFPSVGSILEAVTLDIMPSGEMRLTARPSDVSRARHSA